LSNNGKTTLQLPLKTGLYDANDAFVFVYGYDTANNSNTAVAQTALIQPANFANAFATVLQIPTQQADPANSTALTTITRGQIFASNSALYVCIANGITVKAALSSF
jgi:hypothetical protein